MKVLSGGGIGNFGINVAYYNRQLLVAPILTNPPIYSGYSLYENPPETLAATDSYFTFPKYISVSYSSSENNACIFRIVMLQY